MTDAVDVKRLQQFVPFDGLTLNHLRLLASQLECLNLPPTRVLFKRGQSSDKAFFLIKGSVDLADASFQVRHFNAADDENYLALDDFDTHSVSAITTENSLVYTLPRKLLALVNEWVQFGDNQSNSDDDATAEEESWMDSLLESGLFVQIPPTKIQSLFAKFEVVNATMGDAIIREGEEGDTFFVMKQGYALISKQQGNRSHTLATIRPGQFFGEDALISDRPRGASIIMASDGELMRLGKADFHSLLKDSVVRHISEAELARMEEENDRSIILLDIRPDMESRHDRLSGARNIPLSELRKSHQHLEKTFIYAVFGDSGSNAELGAYLLSDAGFEAYVLDRKPHTAVASGAKDAKPSLPDEQNDTHATSSHNAGKTAQ